MASGATDARALLLACSSRAYTRLRGRLGHQNGFYKFTRHRRAPQRKRTPHENVETPSTRDEKTTQRQKLHRARSSPPLVLVVLAEVGQLRME